MEPLLFPEQPADRTVLRLVHLQRLGRLLRLRREHQLELNVRGLRLLDRSVFSAYCDCRDAGAEDEARALLTEADAVPGQRSSLSAQLSFLDLAQDRSQTSRAAS